MQAKLRVVGGRANQSEVVVELPTVIGRSAKAGMTISHSMVSRKHCLLFEQGGLVLIRDLGSLNGTFVSGRRVDEAALRPGDEFTVGPLQFRVLYRATATGEAPPPRLSSNQEPTPLAHAPTADDRWSNEPAVLRWDALQVTIVTHQPVATSDTSEIEIPPLAPLDLPLSELPPEAQEEEKERECSDTHKGRSSLPAPRGAGDLGELA